VRGCPTQWLLVATTLASFGCNSDQRDECGTVVVGAWASCDSDALDPPPVSCDLVLNTGCDPGEKCTYRVDALVADGGYTLCAADGDVPVGGACTFGTDGIDDCAGGGWCRHGICLATCRAEPDGCPPGDSCRTGLDVLAGTNVGVCQPACDPITSECAVDEGCYLSLASGRGVCDRPSNLQPSGLACEATGTQSCDCLQLNGCAPRHGCILNNSPTAATRVLCAFYCDPTNSGGPTCADGPATGTDCRIIRDFYVNADAGPAHIGMCVEPTQYPCAGCIDETHPGCDVATCSESAQ
jgi:hypothetical protein